MTREQAKANLIAIGVEAPSEEQISNYLNQFQGETDKLNQKLNKQKDAEQKAAELQKKLDEIESANMTELEKAQTAQKNAEDSVAKLQAQMRTMELKASLATKGIIGEDADKLLEGLSGGTLDVEVLGQIIANRENAAAVAKEQEIASKAGNPGDGGGSGGNGGDDKTEAEKFAEKIGKKLGGDNKASTDIVSAYL